MPATPTPAPSPSPGESPGELPSDVEGLIVEAQRIQQSILPQRVPQYAGYDIWGKTVPAEIVSGDFYDFADTTKRVSRDTLLARMRESTLTGLTKRTLSKP